MLYSTSLTYRGKMMKKNGILLFAENTTNYLNACISECTEGGFWKGDQ